jgi:hypothetical protein
MGTVPLFRPPINHAFAAAIAPSDTYDAEAVKAAVVLLGQNPDAHLVCVYCGGAAETWDHVHATVKDKKFSGHGHRLGNLLPCCKPCNSRKGNKDWRTFLMGLQPEDRERKQRERLIQNYLKKYECNDSIPDHLPEYKELQELHRQVLELLAKADNVAAAIRSKASAI